MAGQLTIDTLSASSGVLATQNGMTGIAKAWVNFTGSTAAINGSFNVSSVTRNGVGYYTVNFTTAMPNINYAPVGATGFNTSGGYNGAFITMFAKPTSTYTVAPTTSSFSFVTGYASTTFSSAIDYDYVNIAVLGS